MDNSEHTHNLSFPESITSIFIGSLLLLILSTPLIGGIKDIISGRAGVADYLGFAFLVFVMFPLGLSLLARPFVTKIVVKPHSLEYHTMLYILLADWKNLVNIGYVNHPTVGKKLFIVAQEGRLILRTWAKPFGRFLRQNPKEVEILVSQFRASNGHSFETDVLVNVSQHGESSAD